MKPPFKATAWGKTIKINAQDEMGIAHINPFGDSMKGIPSRKDSQKAKLIVEALNAHTGVYTVQDEIIAVLQQFVNDFDEYGEVLQMDDNGEYGPESTIEKARAVLNRINQLTLDLNQE